MAVAELQGIEMLNLDNITIALSTSSLVGLLFAVFTASRRFGELETKVNTMWAFQMRRAFSEVVTSGIATVNSPLRFTEEAIKALDPIREELKALWVSLPESVRKSDVEVTLEIEKVFGERLLRMVCIPCGLSHGACLLLAMSIAKDQGSLLLHLGQRENDQGDDWTKRSKPS